jgi:3-methyl-2-oxobutanoate hydroxymethyltransferase
MSAQTPSRRVTPLDIRARKGPGGIDAPLVCLTAYTTPIAQIADRHCDIVLVGDSVAMVLHGFPSTLHATMDMMVLHAQAVGRGLKEALLVVDLPFGSYEPSPDRAYESAARIMRETGAHAVKLEGGAHMAPTIAHLTARSIPVMGHIGLTPQSVNVLGGYRVQGRGEDAARIMADAQAVADAGAFSMVLEKVPERLATEITARVGVPTIGIGAGAGCDGQILVIDDMLGLFTEFKPKFVKRFAELAKDADRALADYAREVRARAFPGREHSFGEEPGK